MLKNQDLQCVRMMVSATVLVFVSRLSSSFEIYLSYLQSEIEILLFCLSVRHSGLYDFCCRPKIDTMKRENSKTCVLFLFTLCSDFKLCKVTITKPLDYLNPVSASDAKTNNTVRYKSLVLKPFFSR